MQNTDMYVIVRSRDAGVFAGYLAKVDHNGNWVKLHKSRRIWYWDGAASISQLALDGPKFPANCKFPEELEEHYIYKICELIPTTDKAREAIEKVPPWRA
jgi:hypothetical protein